MAGDQNQARPQEDLNHVLQARRDKLAELQESGKDPFQITKYDQTHHSTEVKEHYQELEGREVSVAGRMMFKRVMGKASFCNIQDLQGRIQIYVAKDSVGEEEYKDFKKLDIGDIIGVKGTVFTTKTGEISIHATEVQLLSKSLQVLPEKFHGLTDTDMRYRQRYVDLIMNEAARIDGANNVQTFFRITIPLLKPVTIFLIITSAIYAFQLFDEPNLLFTNQSSSTVGGPGQSCLTMVWNFYNQAFGANPRMGYASALSCLLFLIIVVVSLIGLRLMNGKEEA